MASGLVALLDDVVAITKLAAASLDDVSAAAGKASSKAAGVVVDDAAVTPRYVTGFSPERELPMIRKIAWGSLRNKLLFILPVALVLSAFAPWAITPLLMLGGLYLSYEGAEKVLEPLLGDAHAVDASPATDPKSLENAKVSGAIRTDLILSAEIMAIALGEVASSPLLTQALSLVVVGFLITVGVYGVVGVIVKMDDVGLYLAKRRGALAQWTGRQLVRGMPLVMRALQLIGTAAMIWVGGGIVLHGSGALGWHAPSELVHTLALAVGGGASFPAAVAAWLVTAVGSALVGLAVGTAVLLAVLLLKRVRS